MHLCTNPLECTQQDSLLRLEAVINDYIINHTSIICIVTWAIIIFTICAHCIQVPELPEIVQGLRYYVQYRPTNRSYYNAQFVYPSYVNDTEVTFTIQSLSRDTAYSIQARVEMRYTHCSNYIQGNFSDPEIFRTNATRE